MDEILSTLLKWISLWIYVEVSPTFVSAWNFQFDKIYLKSHLKCENKEGFCKHKVIYGRTFFCKQRTNNILSVI